jgi:hypothetical protein
MDANHASRTKSVNVFLRLSLSQVWCVHYRNNSPYPRYWIRSPTQPFVATLLYLYTKKAIDHFANVKRHRDSDVRRRRNIETIDSFPAQTSSFACPLTLLRLSRVSVAPLLDCLGGIFASHSLFHRRLPGLVTPQASHCTFSFQSFCPVRSCLPSYGFVD